MFGGSHKAQLKLQYERNVLVTLARVLKVDQCMRTKTSQAPRQWRAWLARESRIRLLHCIFRMCPLRQTMKAWLTIRQNSNVFSSFYLIVSRYLGSMNSPRSSPVANHYGVVEMPTISSMYTNPIKVSQFNLL